jgi:hypothetical protein
VLETRIRQYLEAQHDSAPHPEDRLTQTMRRGRHRLIRKRIGVALTAVAAIVLVVVVSGRVFTEPAMAVSPFTGDELTVINDTPIVLRGELGPEPQIDPPGTDLTFQPIDEPTTNDLAAIEETTRTEGFTDPVVVALGRIEEFETNVYVIRDAADTGSGNSSVIAVGPDYPSYVGFGGPTEDEQWGPSGGWDPVTGKGAVHMRVPDYATWQYIQIDVDGEVFWQRPSDTFIWIPYVAKGEHTVRVTGHDPTNGDVRLDVTFEDPVEDRVRLLQTMIDQLESRVNGITDRITELEK